MMNDLPENETLSLKYNQVETTRYTWLIVDRVLIIVLVINLTFVKLFNINTYNIFKLFQLSGNAFFRYKNNLYQHIQLFIKIKPLFLFFNATSIKLSLYFSSTIVIDEATISFLMLHT